MAKRLQSKVDLFSSQTTAKIICDKLEKELPLELDEEFTWVVSENYFEIAPKESVFMPNWQAFSSIVCGTLVETDLGTKIELKFDLTSAGKFLLGVILCVVACCEVGVLLASTKMNIISFYYFFPIVAGSLFVLGALSRCKSSKEWLLELLSKIVSNGEAINTQGDGSSVS